MSTYIKICIPYSVFDFYVPIMEITDDFVFNGIFNTSFSTVIDLDSLEHEETEIIIWHNISDQYYNYIYNYRCDEG